jgi:hypothetical protein
MNLWIWILVAFVALIALCFAAIVWWSLRRGRRLEAVAPLVLASREVRVAPVAPSLPVPLPLDQTLVEQGELCRLVILPHTPSQFCVWLEIVCGDGVDSPEPHFPAQVIPVGAKLCCQLFRVQEPMSSYQATLVMQERGGYDPASHIVLLNYLEKHREVCPTGRILALRLFSAVGVKKMAGENGQNGLRLFFEQGPPFVTLQEGDYVLGVRKDT